MIQIVRFEQLSERQRDAAAAILVRAFANLSAMVGYVQPDVTFGRVNFPRPSVKALFGFHLVLQTR